MSNPKNKGMNKVFPKYSMTTVKKMICTYLKTDVLDWPVIFMIDDAAKLAKFNRNAND